MKDSKWEIKPVKKNILNKIRRIVDVIYLLHILFYVGKVTIWKE